MSLHSRNIVQSNAENNLAGHKGKTVVSSTLGYKRSALGEIGNKVVSRSNNVLGKAITRDVIKPAVKPAVSSLTTKTSTTVVSKPGTFAKPALKHNGTSHLSKSTSTSSVGSVVLSNPVRKKEADLDVAYSTKTLESHIFDIDKEDEKSPLLVGYYANDIYKYLRSLEDKFPIQEGFLTGQEISSQMRATLVDWLVEVQQQYHLLQETLYLAIQILDRYLQTVKTTTRKFLQLVGVTSMYIACKYEEIYSPDIADFVYITDKAYTKQQLLSMEQRIAKALGFEFCRPISLTFLRRYSKVVDASPLHHCYSKYFLELALMDYSFSHVNPSLVAAASLYIALSIYELNSKSAAEMWDAKMEYYSSYKQNEVEKAAQRLAVVITKASTSKFEAVKKKYSSSKMMKVSIRLDTECEAFKKLAARCESSE